MGEVSKVYPGMVSSSGSLIWLKGSRMGIHSRISTTADLKPTNSSKIVARAVLLSQSVLHVWDYASVLWPLRESLARLDRLWHVSLTIGYSALRTEMRTGHLVLKLLLGLFVLMDPCSI